MSALVMGHRGDRGIQYLPAFFRRWALLTFGECITWTSGCAQSASIRGLSQIDLGLGNEHMLPMIDSSQYHARHVSDHSPLLIDIRVGAVRGNGLWKRNPLWLSLLPVPDPIPELLAVFFRHNIVSADIDTVWEAAQAYLRGQD